MRAVLFIPTIYNVESYIIITRVIVNWLQKPKAMWIKRTYSDKK